jgi:glycosyltransferase involved in cell wall biosynthesis
MKTLLIGALPPPIGGTTILFDMLVNDLKKDKNLHIETLNLPSLNKANPLKKVYILLKFSTTIFKHAKNFDIISLHVSSQGFIYLGAILNIICKIRNTPFIVRAFGGDLKNVYTHSPMPVKKLLSHTFKSDKVLLETKYLVDFFSNEFPNRNIEWYANSRPNTHPPKKTFNANHTNFIFLGHVKKEKGVLDIVEASKLTNRNDYSVHIYGPLADNICASDLNKYNVEYKGVLPPDKINQTLSLYDMLILPTYYEGEGYPGVILEAYGLSIPVIATKWMAIPEIVKDNFTGYLTPPNKPLQLAKTIEKTLENREELVKLSKNAADTYSSFSTEVWTKKYIEICDNVIKHHKKM